MVSTVPAYGRLPCHHVVSTCTVPAYGWLHGVHSAIVPAYGRQGFIQRGGKLGFTPPPPRFGKILSSGFSKGRFLNFVRFILYAKMLSSKFADTVLIPNLLTTTYWKV